MKPSPVRRWWRRNRRRDQRTHRNVVITRTVTREQVTPVPPVAEPDEEEVVDMPGELVLPGVLNTPAFTGGFVAGVLASLVAGLIVLAIERTINNRKDK